MLRHLESCTSHATPSSFIPGLHGSDECLHLRQFVQSLQAGENSRPDTIAPHGRGNRQSDPGSSIVISLDIHNPDGASCRMNNPCVTGQHSAASKLHSWRVLKERRDTADPFASSEKALCVRIGEPFLAFLDRRSEESRVGKEWFITGNT